MWGSQSPHEVDRSHDQGRGGMASTHNSDGELHAISPITLHHGRKRMLHSYNFKCCSSTDLAPYVPLLYASLPLNYSAL